MIWNMNMQCLNLNTHNNTGDLSLLYSKTILQSTWNPPSGLSYEFFIDLP